jgi:hypothetical protein
VLPLDNMNHDRLRTFVEGIHEALITDLKPGAEGDVPQSVMRYKGQTCSLKT